MSKEQRRGVRALTKMTDELLAKAAIFLALDEGSPGFLDRFTEAVSGDAHVVGWALDQALAAQTRAGHASIRLEPGELRVETTSSGASLTACAVSAQDGRIAAAVRLVDAARHPVEGAALQVNTQGKDRMVVTNPAGWVHIGGTGPSLHIQVGRDRTDDRESTGKAKTCSSVSDVVRLPRHRRRDELELAADTGGTPKADETGRWRIDAGGVEFLCLERKGGYDLTVLVAGVTAEFAHLAIGTYGVSFLTQDRERRSRGWIVPLAPSPLGLAGSLYSTNEDRVDTGSLEVRTMEQLIVALGDQLDEVVRRSVQHSDTISAWAAVCERLTPGRSRTVLEAALAERANSQ